MGKKNVLVTGGAGFIGSHMVERLLKLGHQVTIFDNLSTGLKEYINPQATFIKGDVSQESEVKKLFNNKFDVVYHIAGCASAIKSFTDVSVDIKTNYVGTVNIVNNCIAHNIPRLLFASSMTVYGHINKLPVNEDFPCRPFSYYGINKYAAESYVHATSQRPDLTHPFNVTSFRMFNVYGERQSLTNPYQGVMAIFIGNVLRKEPIKIFGDGKQSRDFVYIDNVVDAWIAAMDNKNSHNQIYNIGFGKDYPILELTQTIIATLGYNPKDYPIEFKKNRPGDQRDMKADIKKIKKELQWKPTYNLAQGLKKTITWAQNQKKK